MDLIEVKDILKSAVEYMNNLKSLDNELKSAQQQILNSAQEAELSVQNLFDLLLENIKKTLMERCIVLIKETKNIKDKYLQPLKECQNVIQNKITETDKLINLGENIMKDNETANVVDFNKKTVLLGTLPEVPQLKDVPFITLQYDKNIQAELNNICCNIGHILYMSPVQIHAIQENPGALLVQWQSVGDMEEKFGDIKEYCLQMALGDITKDKTINFQTCYIGPDLQFLIKDIKLYQIYSFRICCKFDGYLEWSPWSVPQTGSTTLKHFSWKPNMDYLLANENKIAKPLKDKPNILYSNGPQLNEGFSVEFTFLEVDDNLDDVFIGLVHDDSMNKENFMKENHSNSLLLKATGDIHLNGAIKSTKLPKIINGTKIYFNCESISDEKIRINVDSQDKRVTYDWTINSANNNLYFVAFFNSCKWKIMVE